MITFTDQSTRKEIDFAPQKVIIAGYTGRDQAAVRAHVSELAAQGIPAPKEVPAIFRTTLDRLTVRTDVDVLNGESCGEAEAVLLVSGDRIWIAVGSDHTDRALERLDVPASKQVCAKPVSAEVWNFFDLRERWDGLILRSWIGDHGREELYQEGRMSAILQPPELLAILRRRLGKIPDGSVIYTGTIPLRRGTFSKKPCFEAELVDESTGRALRCAYRVRRADLL